MKRILKFELDKYHGQKLLYLPAGYKFLNAQNQNERLVFWVIADPGITNVPAKFEVKHTGCSLDYNEGTYLATLQFDGGISVLHLFLLAQ